MDGTSIEHEILTAAAGRLCQSLAADIYLCRHNHHLPGVLFPSTTSLNQVVSFL